MGNNYYNNWSCYNSFMTKEKIIKIIKMILLILLGIFLILVIYFFVGFSSPNENVNWGVSFSQKHAQSLGLDWQELYTNMLDDLGVRKIKIATYWDFIGWGQGQYSFNELDWQIEEAGKRDAEIILVMGMKTPSWPECHIPLWASRLSKEEQQEEILKYLEQIVLRYRDVEAIKYWQVENEPFFPFGRCPWRDKKFLKKEIELVKSLDSRPVIISESGEFPLWINAAKYGDIVGITMYKKVWMNELGTYFIYPFPATFYRRKAALIKFLFNKNIICVELQAEPWGPSLIYDLPLKEQEKTMNLERFKKNIEFAKKVGFDEYYLWGVEWWYWMKERHDRPEIWEEAKILFK